MAGTPGDEEVLIGRGWRLAGPREASFTDLSVVISAMDLRVCGSEQIGQEYYS